MSHSDLSQIAQAKTAQVKTAEAKTAQAIAYLRTPQAIRDRCGRLFELACQDKLQHFRCNLSRLEPTSDYVLQVIRENYPDLNVPFHSRWRHFGAGGRDRTALLTQKLTGLDPLEQARTKFDLVVPSVLLDAGAGAQWRYVEPDTGEVFQRSEGLAVASFHSFCQGTFAKLFQPDLGSQQALRVDAIALKTLTETALADSFQVSAENPLVGLSGRLDLLHRLGQTLECHPQFFGAEQPRPGGLVDYLVQQAVDGQLAASQVLQAVLLGLGEIWAGRVALDGVNLGDVWAHSALSDAAAGDLDGLPGVDLVPFHKLSQWLTYSLLEPLQELGLTITHLDQLTGLAEYRNGGLCVDLGLLEPKYAEITQVPHLPSSEVIVEWRALTVILLDRIADTLRQSLRLDAQTLPLVKILEGGTWAAGRKIAAERRPGGVPPIQIKSDGTVF